MNRKNPLFLVLGIIVAVAGCSSPTPAAESASQPTEPTSTSETAKVTLVDDPSLVCMVNNQFMGTKQIEVEIEGTTYYGCCEMCKAKLAKDPEARTGVDPVSGASVDKAHAVLGKTSTGAIYYFESTANLAVFAKGT